MTVFEGFLLFLAAVGGGALNSVAGGGSFLTFPMLLFVGVPPIPANATSTVALWPGTVASATAYRNEIRAERPRLLALSLVSLLGGFLGARLLLSTPQETFEDMIPWLLLAATLVFAFGGSIVSRLRARRADAGPQRDRPHRVLGLVVQFVIAVYGGFFGGGIGILMLAALSVTGMQHIHAMNGLKNWLGACINGIAVVTFIVAGAVLWPQAVVMVTGSVAGGYGGASLARRIAPAHVRRFVIGVGVAMTAYFFIWG